MKTTQNTILVTGGSAGIGFEIAKLFGEKGNHVIILGRNAERLQQAAAKLTNVTAIAGDVSNPADVDALVQRVNSEFPNLNVLINNAGRANAYKLAAGQGIAEKAREEMETNYFSVLSLTEKLLPLLQKQPEAAIVNITSIVALTPGINIPTYSATKAALHSFSQALRHTLAKDTNIKVFEVMPPLVNTELAKEIGGERGIPPVVVAEYLLKGFENDEYEIHVAGTANFYKLFLSSPAQALEKLNQGR